jgi:integrase
LHKPSGLAVVSISGHDTYLGPYNSIESREEYRRLISGWRANQTSARTRGGGVPSDVTVAELALAYIEHCEQYYVKDGATTSMVRTARLAIQPLRRLYADELAAEFSVQQLRVLQAEFVRAGLARTEVNRRTSALVRMFRWGVVQLRIPASVPVELRMLPGLRKGRTPAPERPPVRPVSDAVIETAIPFMSAPVAAMVRMMQATGMRPAEVVQLRTMDVVTDASGTTWYTPSSHKTQHHGKIRKICLGPRARAIFADWTRPGAPAEYLFQPLASMRDAASRRRKGRRDGRERGRQVTGRRVRERFSVDSFRKHIGRACDKANPHPLADVPDAELTDAQRARLAAHREATRFHPNQVRHTVATMIRREFDVDAARGVLGHASVDVTTIYAERDAGRIAEVMERLG